MKWNAEPCGGMGRGRRRSTRDTMWIRLRGTGGLREVYRACIKVLNWKRACYVHGIERRLAAGKDKREHKMRSKGG